LPAGPAQATIPAPIAISSRRCRIRIPVNFEELSAFVARNPIYSLAFVGLTIAIIVNELSRLLRGYKSLRPAEVTLLMNQDNALVVDLRAYADYEKGHIAGSKNVLMSQFDPESKQLAPAKALPIVLVCQSGITVAGAAKRLKKAGFERVHVLEGGIAAWQQAELPLVKGKG
jgi:rhodanese-related sulfurtransferase